MEAKSQFTLPCSDMSQRASIYNNNFGNDIIHLKHCLLCLIFICTEVDFTYMTKYDFFVGVEYHRKSFINRPSFNVVLKDIQDFLNFFFNVRFATTIDCKYAIMVNLFSIL